MNQINFRPRRFWQRCLAAAMLGCLAFLSVSAQAQQVTTLIQFTNVWKYDQSGRELGILWRSNAYNDAFWTSGRGLLGNEFDTPSSYTGFAPISPPLVISSTVTTYFFRTTFVFGGPTNSLQLYVTNLVDDGCAIYLNGRLTGGVRMPPEYNATTLATGASTEGLFDVVALTNVFLRQGQNLLAAEVHQASTVSSDIMFGLKLAIHGPEQPLAITRQPADQILLEGEAVALQVAVSGGPVRFYWEKDGAGVGSNSSPFVRASARVEDSGNYRVICSNSLTVVTSDVAVVRVFPDRSGPKALAALAESSLFGARTIHVTFSEAMLDPVVPVGPAVRNPDNYSVRRLGTADLVSIGHVQYDSAFGAVLHVLESDAKWVPFANYGVLINHVADVAGNAISPDTILSVRWNATNGLITTTQYWDFNASAIFDPAVYDEAWFTGAYEPGPWWGQGYGSFYDGISGGNQCSFIGAPQTPTGWQPEPMLYRTSFQYPPHWPSNATLRLKASFDDALVLFLNGIEVYRNNVPGPAGSPITGTTRAASAPNPPPCLSAVTLAVTNLQPGSNCLAAAVVQYGSGSGDADSNFALSMDATIVRVPALPPESLPILQALSPDTNCLRLSWTGGGYALESSTNLDLGPVSYPFGPWTQVPQMSNPYLWNLTNGPARFFRLKK